jgi:Arc/MetJ-type ribon-helix-helix transcriptional regulator
MAEKEKIEIPKDLYGRIKERIKGTEFTSVSDYVVFVLGELMAADGDEKKKTTAEDDEKVKERLRSLGYID